MTGEKIVKLGKCNVWLYQATVSSIGVSLCRKHWGGFTPVYSSLTHAQFAKLAKAMGYVKAEDEEDERGYCSHCGRG